MANAIIEKATERFEQSHQSLAREFSSIRAGRANASLLDRIQIEYYGALTPLNQLASITIPEARVLLISPFDNSSYKGIEHASNASDLGINPTNDGSVVRLVIPALTEETRKELAKEVKKIGENAKVAIRNIRRDAMDDAKKQEKSKEITEDELKSLEKNIQKATDDAIKHIESMTAYIDRNLTTDLSLKSLSNHFFVSEDYISHLFTARLHVSPHQYVLSMRLAHARTVLISGRQINRAYLDCGFKDYSSFYRAFKKAFSLSPKELQKIYMEDPQKNR